MARNALIVAWVVVQLAIPAHYYFLRESRYDERFAWRMFSEVRVLDCVADYRQAGRPVPFENRFHASWITLVKRGRPSVIERVTGRLCEEAGNDPVTLDLVCREADGRMFRLTEPWRNQCAPRSDR